MKKVLFIFSLTLISLISIAENQANIKLKGKLTGGPKSQSTLVEVLLFENEIQVNFLECLGNLTVTIVDENEHTVYNENVNSCVIKSISINVQNLSSGWHKITVSDTQGGWVEGSFFIEN